MKHLEIIMVGQPKPGEFEALRKAGRGLGVVVSNATVSDPPAPGVWAQTPLYALETWRGAKATDLRDFVFPDRMVLVTGTTNRGLEDEWREVINGSIYIDQSNWGETYLSVPTAGAIVMWEFHKQRGV